MWLGGPLLHMYAPQTWEQTGMGIMLLARIRLLSRLLGDMMLHLEHYNYLIRQSRG